MTHSETARVVSGFTNQLHANFSLLSRSVTGKSAGGRVGESAAWKSKRFYRRPNQLTATNAIGLGLPVRRLAACYINRKL